MFNGIYEEMTRFQRNAGTVSQFPGHLRRRRLSLRAVGRRLAGDGAAFGAMFNVLAGVPWRGK
jgi:hypothetical protein